MPRFRYIVVNAENRQLSGAIDAPESDTARLELQDLGFSIISIEEVTPTDENKEEGLEFEFKGTDANMRTLSGTIKSEDRFHAFSRLMKEYEVDVEYLVQTNLSEEEQTTQKAEGIIELMKKYREEVEAKTEKFHKEKIGTIDRSFEREKALVMRQIDFVLKKVNTAIDEFGADLKPQDKKTISNYVNKILRLKNSTNLDYIKTTCETLLKFLQNAEIFTHREEHVDKKVQLYADTQEMIGQLKTGKDFGDIDDLEGKIITWQKSNIVGRDKISFTDKMTNGFLDVIKKIIHEPEEIREQNIKLKTLNNQIKQYYYVYLKSKDNDYRKQASKIIKTLRTKKKSLQSQIKELRAEYRKIAAEKGETNVLENLLHGFNGLTGWLLMFYLVFYFASAYIVSKQIGFPLNDVPSVFYLFQSGVVKYILPVTFLLHASTSIKLNFFRKNLYSGLVIFPLFIIGSFLILFNF